MSSDGDLDQPPERHRPSHLDLLRPCPIDSIPKDIDAVVVPTHRPDSYLRFSIDLARDLGCPIVILCSDDARAPQVAERLAGTAGVAATVSSLLAHHTLHLRTARLDAEWRNSNVDVRGYWDVGNKRNVTLLLGRLMGWQRLLFLDDDISGLTAAAVRLAAGALEPIKMQVIGWRYPEFPDNSVVCHALRSSGRRQDVFIGSGALLIHLEGWLPFFPPIYNEDWLFWHDFAVRRQVGLARLEVTQRAFDPYDPARARREEFGDVLAEGVFNLIHVRRSVSVAQLPGYWDGVLRERRALLEGIIQRLEHLAGHTGDARHYEKVLLAIEASLDQLGRITAQHLADFVGAWAFDRFRWNAQLHNLPRFTRIVDAFNWLGIHDVHTAEPSA